MKIRMFKFGKKSASKKIQAHADYSNIDELDDDINRCGCNENLNLMVFIDRTSSCKNTGRRTFGGQNLHTIREGICNPFQLVFRTLDNVVNFNQKATFPTYAYGSGTAQLFRNNLHFLGMCHNAAEVERVYCDTTDIRDQARPTCFRYIVNEAIRVQKETGQYYVVLIITDGSPEAEFMKDDVRAIFEAMDYPLSFVCVGVGDGPFDFMESLDDMDLGKLGLTKSEMKALKGKKTKFDNFQFVPLKDFVPDNSVQITRNHIEKAYFHMFMEIPGQYRWISNPKGLNFRPSMAAHKSYPAESIVEEHAAHGIPPPYGELGEPPAFNAGMPVAGSTVAGSYAASAPPLEKHMYSGEL